MMSLIAQKIQQILACPQCVSSDINIECQEVVCLSCGARYAIDNTTPVLIPPCSPIFEWFQRSKSTGSPRKSGFAAWSGKILSGLRLPVRMWTLRSKRVMREMLEVKNPDAPESVVVLVGSGQEPVYKKLLSAYRDIIRVGLAHTGDVDIFCDLCSLPIGKGQVDLIFSSSVLEHVYDPEKAIRDMHRILKSGGYIYAEIPFIRGFHMAPVDYQRYTISGIEMLFSKCGFVMIDKGICSGPFTAMVLHIVDFWRGILSFNRYVRIVGLLLLQFLLHPIKYLDRLCESSEWAMVTACNFYYLGVKKDTQDSPETIQAQGSNVALS